MARRNYRKSSKKIQPSVETLTFYLGATDIATQDPGTVPGQSTYYCDLSQVASLANRRFYRQGINWAVAGFRMNSTNVVNGTTQPVSDSPEGAVMVQKLPNTWIMSNAWEKSMRAWMDMNKDAMEDTSVRPKFLDFKVYMDETHHELGSDRNILPAVVGTGFTAPTVGYTDAIPGEWIYSKVVIPETSTSVGAATEYELIAVGRNNPGASSASGLNAKSLIEGYASSRGLPDITDPNTPDDAAVYGENWMLALKNEGTLQDNLVIDDLTEENNQVPYPFENGTVDGFTFPDTMYPGGANQLDGLQIHSIENITGSTIGGVTYLRGGSFPCGLVRIDVFNNDQTYQQLNVLQIDLVPGSHRGYLCEPMTEM